MFHFTNPDNVDSILKNGLLAGRPIVTDSLDPRFLRGDPVYLTTSESHFIRAFEEEEWANFSRLEVDILNLPLVADLVSLADAGARFADGMFDMTGKAALKPLLRFSDAYCFIEIEHLIDPDTDAAKVAIAITGTAACLSNIRPSLITLT
jgi:hypothetical protein